MCIDSYSALYRFRTLRSILRFTGRLTLAGFAFQIVAGYFFAVSDAESRLLFNWVAHFQIAENAFP